MIRNAEVALELDGVFSILRRYLASPLGARALDEQRQAPRFDSSEEARAALEETGEAMEWLRAGEASDRRDFTPLPRFQGLRDMQEAVAKLSAEGVALEAHEIFGLLELLDRAEETRQRLWRERARRQRLGEYGDRIGEFASLLRELSGKILPNGELADHASSGLARVRRQIEQQRQRVHTTLERFVRKHFDEGVLQDDYATIRNGRSVVPVKASWKGQVEGVIHAASSSGQTVFVEPLETITENNKLVRLLEEEQREILRILREMTERLRLDREPIGATVTVLGFLETLFAKARFGRAFRCCLPTFSQTDALRLDWARHPLLEDVLQRDGRKVVPLALKLDGGCRVLVVSGPNAGGKTVVLKTVGLLALMAQSGIPVPAAEAQFPWFDRILAAIGDAQSIEASLSTFSAHVETLKRMMAETTGRSLVIIDELGGATDPQEGGALGVAIVRYFQEAGAFALISTHLPALKVYSATAAGVLSAAMGFDEKTLSPTHKLMAGVPGESAGLAIAERLGVPAAVIRRARQALADQEEQAAAFVSKLRRQVEDYEAKREELRIAEQRLRERERELIREMEQREKTKLAELERRFQKALREAEQANRRTLDETLQKIEQKAEKRRATAEAQRLAARAQREARERLQAAASEALETKPAATAATPAAPTGLREGVSVKLGAFGATGRILRQMGEDRWEVQVGQLKMQVRRGDISEILEPAKTPASAALPEGVSFKGSSKSLESLSEINVIGRTVDEAQSEVDKFLDEAVLAEVRRLRVIHGHGTNALRRSLWRMFANHIHVDRYYQAEQYEGGAGATIVEVKV